MQPGMGFDLQQLLTQAQQMQEEMARKHWRTW
jgi:DNA-binding protein YbaB